MMKRIIVLILVLCLVSTFFVSCSSNNEVADLVAYGTIYTAENDNIAEAFAVKDGKYIFVGSKEDAKKYIKEGKTEIIDKTDEGLIIPGCTEGHSHYFGVYGAGNVLSGQGLSYKEMLNVIKNDIKEKNIKQFYTYGWNLTDILEDVNEGKNFADEIETIAPSIPVVLLDTTGHNAVCNTTALKITGLLENPQVRGGEIKLDKDGKPSGLVSDQAVGYLMENAVNPSLDDKQSKEACVTAINTLLRQGYTNVLDAYINQFCDDSLSKTLKQLDAEGELSVNVSSCYNIKSYDADRYKEKVDKVAEIVKDYKSQHYNPGYIKLFADGVVESATGWMLEKYENVEEGKEYGNQIWEKEELNSIVEYANSKDILIHTHSYGDAACKTLLDAYINSNEKNKNEYRNCLGHVRNIQNDDIIRAAKNKIPIAENLIWHTDVNDERPDEKKQKDIILSHISEDTYYSGYPMKSLIDNGVIMSSSTDSPAGMIIEGNIMNVLEVATTGIMPGDTVKPFTEKELLTVKEALQALTINGAWQLGLEKERGSVKVGKYADFVILDKNILDYQGEELRTIHDTKIKNTYFEGKMVYSME